MATKLIHYLVCLFFLFNSSPAQSVSSQDIDWARIREAFRLYFESPSIDNANNILAAIPDSFDNHSVNQKEWEKTLFYIMYDDFERFMILGNQIKKGDKIAIRIGFKTLNISDGAFAEYLSSLLGDSIKASPSEFLEELERWAAYESRDLTTSHVLKVILLHIDAPNYREDVIKNEIETRKKSLESVDNPVLKEIRDICINILLRERECSAGY